MIDVKKREKIYFAAVLLVLYFMQISVFCQQEDIKDSGQRETLKKIIRLNSKSEFNTKNSPREAISYAKEALVLSQTINNEFYKGYSLLNIGTAYRYVQALDVSMEYLLRALKIFTELGNKNYIAKTYTKIGMVYFGLGYIDKSLDYYKRALDIFQNTGDSLGVSSSLNGIGLVYNSKRDFKKALKFLNRAFSIEEEMGNSKGLSRVCDNLGIIYNDMGNYQDALPLFQRALTLNRKAEDKWGEVEVLNNLGNLYTKLNNYDKAAKMLNQSRKLAMDIQDRNLLLDNYEYTSSLYEALGRYREALKYRKLHHSMYRIVSSDKKKDNIAELQVLFATEKKDNEIKLLQSEKDIKNATIKAQRFWLLFIISVMVLVLFISVFIIIHIKHKMDTYKLLARKNLKIVEYERYIEKGDSKALMSMRRAHIIETRDQVVDNEIKYSGSSLTREQKQSIFNDLIQIIEDKKYYLNHDASLSDVSEKLGINRSYISQVINEEFGKSFSNLINEYRVAEARRLLAEDSERVFTIASVASSVGFNSVNVFNKAFKKYTGITPSFFVNSVQKTELQTS
ncbi:hypothetical protein DRQ07_07810 [candidate division KSB1 bacterium]|nr:MAG: hypothetical protein DRQ07_07810 [candidate division KSB1 bacterium]